MLVSFLLMVAGAASPTSPNGVACSFVFDGFCFVAGAANLVNFAAAEAFCQTRALQPVAIASAAELLAIRQFEPANNLWLGWVGNGILFSTDKQFGDFVNADFSLNQATSNFDAASGQPCSRLVGNLMQGAACNVGAFAMCKSAVRIGEFAPCIRLTTDNPTNADGFKLFFNDRNANVNDRLEFPVANAVLQTQGAQFTRCFPGLRSLSVQPVAGDTWEGPVQCLNCDLSSVLQCPNCDDGTTPGTVRQLNVNGERTQLVVDLNLVDDLQAVGGALCEGANAFCDLLSCGFQCEAGFFRTCNNDLLACAECTGGAAQQCGLFEVAGGVACDGTATADTQLCVGDGTAIAVTTVLAVAVVGLLALWCCCCGGATAVHLRKKTTAGGPKDTRAAEPSPMKAEPNAPVRLEACSNCGRMIPITDAACGYCGRFKRAR